MKNFRNWTVALVSVVMMSVAAVSIAKDAAPSATLTINEKQVGFLLTGDWGHGTLDYKGEKHMFHMGGAKIGGIGISSMKVDGSVYYLKNRSDFEGVYFKADAGLTLAKGKVGSWLKNDKGVVIHLGANSDGIALQIGVEGLKVSF
ncbi:MAG: hypothetical protein ABJ308_16510 [Halieaceae bacterium]